jgi:hypothetical protein
MMTHTCKLSYEKGIGRRIFLKGWP